MVKVRQNFSKGQLYSYKVKTKGKVLPWKLSIYLFSIHQLFHFFPYHTLPLLLFTLVLHHIFSVSAAPRFPHRTLCISKSKVSANTTASPIAPFYSKVSPSMTSIIITLKVVGCAVSDLTPDVQTQICILTILPADSYVR